MKVAAVNFARAFEAQWVRGDDNYSGVWRRLTLSFVLGPSSCFVITYIFLAYALALAVGLRPPFSRARSGDKFLRLFVSSGCHLRLASRHLLDRSLAVLF